MGNICSFFIFRALKKGKTIFFIIFALVFFSKNLASYAADSTKFACYAMDLEEKDAAEKSEKEPLDEKEMTEYWLLSHSKPLIQTSLSQPSFRFFDERIIRSAYFEITLPPPELKSSIS